MWRTSLIVFSIALVIAGVASMSAQSTKSSGKKPAIDEAAPAKIETATLALG